MNRRIEELSREFNDRRTRASRSEGALRALLLAKTSCYVYWNNDFWFDHGKRMVQFTYQQMEEAS
jgi:hypothetical protein